MQGELNDKSRQEKIDWDPCPTGEIDGMVQRIRNRRRQVFAGKLAAGAALGMLLAITALNFSARRNGDFGDITCADVARHMEAYVDGKLDPQLTRQIQRHLAECPACGSRYRQLMQDRRTRNTQTKSAQADSVESFGPVLTLSSSAVSQIGAWLVHA